ncbi:carboxypeptidase regulatory-like domain-containing protein [Pedobacter sp. 22226]|uniref:TonB-dependent receptor n=1 Tax=Pedobacter sp. 22226 TaxID=3453894 RepID=UPI003F86F5A0
MAKNNTGKALYRCACFLMLLFATSVLPDKTLAQTITTASLSGTVYIDSAKAVGNVVVIAEHVPSATRYVTISFGNGKYVLPNLRIGGPYKITARLIGYPEAVSYINQLSPQDYPGYNIRLNSNVTNLEEVTVTEVKKQVLKNDGTVFSISQSLISKIPSINRNIQDIMRLSPFASGGGIMGVNPRMNNFTIDGSLLITYGLGKTVIVGNTTGTDPIGLDAIEELQVNVAPFDVRQSGFTSAGINVITKKGDNNFRLSAFNFFNGANLKGTKINHTDIKGQNYQENQTGFNLGGAIVKNKLFYQLNYEKRNNISSASSYIANTGSTAEENSTRVLATDLNNLSAFLIKNYQYETGPYQNYNLHSNNDKLVAQLDWNVSENSALGLRVLYLNSYQDKTLSNDNFVGLGNRNNNPYAMSYQRSNFVRFSNALSVRLAYTSKINKNIAQQFTVSYANLPDYRQPAGDLKPLVDILDGEKNYISFGTDIFAPQNNLKTNIYQLQEHINFHILNHNFIAGADANLVSVKNTFVPVMQGYYQFNSLNDFYNSTPAGTATPLGISSGLARPAMFQKGYSLLPNGQIPTFNFGYAETGIYLQDSWQISNQFTITPGIRLDRNYFIGKPGNNAYVSGLTFQNPDGNTEQLNTGQLPPNQFRFSPRMGFTLQLKQIDFLKIHGGIGVFSGRLPMVLLGEQFRNNGLGSATFFTQNTQNNPFLFSPDAYTPTNTAHTSYDIVLLDKNFKYPQALKNNLSFNFYAKQNWIISIEGLYNHDISGFYARNANIDNTSYTINADGRERLLNNAINAPIIQHAYILANTKGGRQYAISVNAKKSFKDDFYLFLNYTYGNAKDRGSFTGTEPASEFISAPVNGNPNQPELAYSAYDQRHRIFAFLTKSYHFTAKSTTTFSVITEFNQTGRFSYTYAGTGDVNGDGAPGNDLIFVPANSKQINLIPYTNNKGILVTEAMQWQSLEKFIQSSPYLNSKKGSFAERNGSILPFATQVDIKISHELKVNKHSFQLSLDCINLPNLIHSSWGVKYLPANTQPIEAVTYDSFRVYPDHLNKAFTPDNALLSVWQIQLGLRYRFGN